MISRSDVEQCLKDRYFQANETDTKKLVPEGIRPRSF